MGTQVCRASLDRAIPPGPEGPGFSREDQVTPADRQRLARILGMLGSEHAGERASAALQAEA